MIQDNKYLPSPVNVDNIQLPAELVVLAEDIAKNVHEVWALQRMKEGWKYGPERNGQLKETPCLVPYEQLPDEEKSYDRNTALATLKYIVSQGFEIKLKKLSK